MTLYCEYTTLDQVRGSGNGRYLDMGTSDDAVLFDLIRAVSREIEDAAGHRRFFPRIETRYYDAPEIITDVLMFDDDCLAVTTFTNGTGNTFSTSDYNLYPLNVTPKYKVKIKVTATEQLSPDGADYNGVISVNGVWGYHEDYSGAWVATNAVLSTDATSTAATIDVTTGYIVRGQLLKIDSEYLYSSTVVTSTSDTVTVVRAVNGSTATTHGTGATIYKWACHDIVNNVATIASAAYYKLRANPVGDTVQVGDLAFATPKDVAQYIARRLRANGLVRQAIG